MEKLEQLKVLLSELEVHYEKFNKGTKAAATRARQSAQEMRHLLNEMRVEILETKKSM